MIVSFALQPGQDIEKGYRLKNSGEEVWKDEVTTLDPLELVEATFQRLFPDTFQYALPVKNHKVCSP